MDRCRSDGGSVGRHPRPQPRTATAATPQSLENNNGKDGDEDLDPYGGLFDNEQKKIFPNQETLSHLPFPSLTPNLMEGFVNQRLDFGKIGYGCNHCRRRCRIRAPRCNKIYTCRHCHNGVVMLNSETLDWKGLQVWQKIWSGSRSKIWKGYTKKADKSFLPSKDMEWYFYSPRDRKYPNGSRTNRATQVGYWKATGEDRPLHSQNKQVGK